MKKIVLLVLMVFALYALGSAASIAIKDGYRNPNTSSIAIQATSAQNIQSSVKSEFVANQKKPDDRIPIDAAGQSGSFSLRHHVSLPTILADVTESEPNDSRATANPINPGDRVYCGNVNSSTDPSDYFVFTLDNTYSAWQVEVYTYAPDPTECSPAIVGTRVQLYDTTAAGVLIGYDSPSSGFADMYAQFLAPGTYYFRVRPLGSVSGYYHAELICTEQPCVATCPSGGIPEGEVMPDTFYTDTYNLGCTSPGGPFTPYTIGETMCGTAATWLQGGYAKRDIDWYEFTLATDDDILFTSKADFLSLVYIWRAPCPGTFITGYIVPPCEDLSFTATLTAGTYYVQVLPAQFGGLPCPPNYADYFFTITTPTIGDNCQVPITIASLPYSDTRSNCDMADDYQPSSSLTGPDVVYQMVLSEETTMDISLCNTVPNTYDTWLGVWGENDCGGTTFIAEDDDGCTTPEYGASKITNLTLAAGTYYILVDTYEPIENCQDYNLTITAVTPCVVECPPLAIPEGEPDCAPGYYDNFNAGCNETPVNFSPITPGQTICGTTGWYVRNDTTMRDTDWYLLDLPTRGTFTYTGSGEFPLDIFIIKPGPAGYECDSLRISFSASAGPCDTAVIQTALLDGTYWLFASVQQGFSQIPCGSTYWISCSWEANPDFPQVGLAQTGNVPNVGVSNFGALGENALQGNTFNWRNMGAKDYAGTFIFGNAANHIWWKYGDNPEMTPPRGNVDLNLTNPFHPTAGFDDGDVLGIDVRYCGAGYTTPTGAPDLFLHTYRLVNTGTSSVTDLFAGIYMDWDVDTADTVFLDRTNKVVIQQGIGTSLYDGWALVSDSPLRNLTAISQEIYSYPNSGWLPDSMWARLSANVDGTPYYYTDMGSMISTGPYTIAPGDSVVIVFAQIGGSSATNIVSRANLARTLDNPCIMTGPPGCTYIVGDANNSLSFNGLDVTYSVGYFKGGPPPPYSCECTPGHTWYVAGDVNASCSFNGLDVTYMVSYFKGGPAVHPCTDCPPAR
jgi:hypothetical protein